MSLSIATSATIDLSIGETYWAGNDQIRCSSGTVTPTDGLDPYRIINVHCECNCYSNACDLVAIKEFANGESRNSILDSGIYSSYRCEKRRDERVECHL